MFEALRESVHIVKVGTLKWHVVSRFMIPRVTIHTQATPPGTRIVRVMPNMPCLVLAGTSVYSLGQHATSEDGDVVQKLMCSTGICEKVAEPMIDAVTGVSGSGPAYVSC